MLGKLASFGFGRDKVVPLSYHVDYFNTPWKDPFSDPKWSARQAAYCQVLKNKELYYTPLLLVDGRYDALGNAGLKVEAALKKALADPAEVSLSLAWLPDSKGTTIGKSLARTKTPTATPRKPSDPEEKADEEADEAGAAPARKMLKVIVRGLTKEMDGRELLVAAALSEDPLTTKVPKGENEGKTLVEHHVVRNFGIEAVTLKPGQPASLTIPIELKRGWKAERCSLAVFLQDEKTGQVFQAESLAWTPPRPGRS